MNYKQFSELEAGRKITRKQYGEIFSEESHITIKDDGVRGAKTVRYWDVKVGDFVNNGKYFIELIY